MEALMAKLKVLGKKASSPEEFELSLDRVTIGRAPDNVLVLDDKATSRHHAEIRKNGGAWELADLGSSNGVWIDGKKVKSFELGEGTVFLIGNTRFTFVDAGWESRTIRVDQEEMLNPEEILPVSGNVLPAPPPPTPIDDPREAEAQIPAHAPLSPPPPMPATPAPAQTPSLSDESAEPSLMDNPLPPVQGTPRPIMMPQLSPAPETFDEGSENAGFGIRLGAYLLDSMILGVIVMLPAGFIIKIVAGKAPGLLLPLSILIFLLVMAVSVAYLVIPWAGSGATPGKKILHLQITRDDGPAPLGYGKALLRILGYAISSLILGIGFLMALFTPDKKALHDMIAGTRVIRKG